MRQIIECDSGARGGGGNGRVDGGGYQQRVHKEGGEGDGDGCSRRHGKDEVIEEEVDDNG